MRHKIKTSECVLLAEYREKVLSEKRKRYVSQHEIGDDLRPIQKQGRVSAVERGEVEFHTWNIAAWCAAYELSEMQFVRMVTNAQIYYSLPIDERAEWMSEKRRWSKSMPLFETQPATVAEIATMTESLADLEAIA